MAWKTDDGSEGNDDDPTSPLSRAVNQLLEDGKPFSRLSQCFCSEPIQGSSILRWLGVFVLSAGGRVIFFPGFNTTQYHIRGFKGKSLQWDQSFDFDHVSLEKDFKRWHVTNSKSKNHLGRTSTIPLGDGRFLWFGISLANYTVLRKVKRKTTVYAQTPPSDSLRRKNVFLQSRDGADFQIVGFHPDANKDFAVGFPHFAFIVGSRGFPLYKGRDLGFPEGSPFLAKPLPTEKLQLPIRSRRFSLSPEIDIQITTAWLPGGLTTPIAITV